MGVPLYVVAFCPRKDSERFGPKEASGVAAGQPYQLWISTGLQRQNLRVTITIAKTLGILLLQPWKKVMTKEKPLGTELLYWPGIKTMYPKCFLCSAHSQRQVTCSPEVLRPPDCTPELSGTYFRLWWL